MAFLIRQDGVLICVGQHMNVEGVGPENLAFRFPFKDHTGTTSRYEFTAGRSRTDPKTIAIFIDAVVQQGNGSSAKLPLVIAGIQFKDATTVLPDAAQDAVKTIAAVIQEYTVARMVASDNVKCFIRQSEKPQEFMQRMDRMRNFLCQMLTYISKELDGVILHGKGLKIRSE